VWFERINGQGEKEKRTKTNKIVKGMRRREDVPLVFEALLAIIAVVDFSHNGAGHLQGASITNNLGCAAIVLHNQSQANRSVRHVCRVLCRGVKLADRSRARGNRRRELIEMI